MITEKLLEVLKFNNKKLKSCLDSIEIALRNSVFVERQLLPHYTNHSIDHIERIIKNLGKLLENYPNLLNEDEKFVLLAATYFHDIGMESPTHAGLPKKEQYTQEELERIRENHHKSSAKMIIKSLDPKSGILLGLENCKEYGYFIAEIAKYHRKLELRKLEKTSIGGENIRLPLLASLLRLGDELDKDYRRVKMDFLKIREIPTISKFHWWAHHYVESVFIKKGHIKLFFRFPETFEERNDLKGIFQEKILAEINEVFYETYDILYEYGIRLFRDIEIEKERIAAKGELEEIPEDLMAYVNKLINNREIGKRQIKDGLRFIISEVSYSGDRDVIELLDNISNFIKEEKYQDVVIEAKKCKNLLMSPKDRMNLLQNEGNAYYILGELEKAKECCEEILRISEKKAVQTVYGTFALAKKANCKGNIGLIYKGKGERDKALAFYLEALKIHRKLGNKQGEAYQLGNIGIIYRDKGELNEALKYHQEALKLHKEVGNRKGEATQLGNIGVIYRSRGEINKALEYNQKALGINRVLKNKGGEASDFSNIGNIYSESGDINRSLKYHLDALKLHRKLKHKLGEASDLGNIGNIYFILGELNKALKYQQEALEIFTFAYPQYMGKTLLNLARTFFKKNDYAQCFEFCGKSLEKAYLNRDLDLSLKFLLRVIEERIVKNDWENIKKIEHVYVTRNIKEEWLNNLLKTIYNYALYRETGKEETKKKYEESRGKLSKKAEELFEELIKKENSINSKSK